MSASFPLFCGVFISSEIDYRKVELTAVFTDLDMKPDRSVRRLGHSARSQAAGPARCRP
jgi:hypothetical protein